MNAVENEITQMNELVVFGIGFSDLATFQGINPGADMSLVVDQAEYGCETNFDDFSCSAKYTKTK